MEYSKIEEYVRVLDKVLPQNIPSSVTGLLKARVPMKEICEDCIIHQCISAGKEITIHRCNTRIGIGGVCNACRKIENPCRGEAWSKDELLFMLASLFRAAPPSLPLPFDPAVLFPPPPPAAPAFVPEPWSPPPVPFSFDHSRTWGYGEALFGEELAFELEKEHGVKVEGKATLVHSFTTILIYVFYSAEPLGLTSKR